MGAMPPSHLPAPAPSQPSSARRCPAACTLEELAALWIARGRACRRRSRWADADTSARLSASTRAAGRGAPGPVAGAALRAWTWETAADRLLRVPAARAGPLSLRILAERAVAERNTLVRPVCAQLHAELAVHLLGAALRSGQPVPRRRPKPTHPR